MRLTIDELPSGVDRRHPVPGRELDEASSVHTGSTTFVVRSVFH